MVRYSYFLFGFVFLLSGFHAIASLQPLMLRDRAVIEVDMMVDRPGTANLWVNDQSRPPARAKLNPGTRQIYKFDGNNQNITYIRLDPTPGQDQSNVAIYGVRVISPTGSQSAFTAAQMEWQAFNAISQASIPEGITWQSSTSLILVSHKKIALDALYPNFMHELIASSSSIRSLPLTLVLCIGIFLAIACGREGRIHLAAGSLTLLAVMQLPRISAAFASGSLSVSSTVGLAAYSGRSLLPNHVFLWSALAASILIAFILAFIFYKTKPHDAHVNAPYPAISVGKFPKAGFAFFVLLTAILLQPDWQFGFSRHALMWNGLYVPNWDSNNALIWSYMTKLGYLPFKDFWYPYAFSYLFDLGIPWGKLLAYSYLLTLYAIFLLSAWRLIGSIGSAGILLLLMVAGGWVVQDIAILSQPERYILPLCIVFSYIAANRKGSGLSGFWLACVLGVIFEPSQVVYAGPGVAAILLIDVYRIWPDWRQILHRLIRDFAVPAALLFCVIALFVASGVVSNVYDFYARIGEVSLYMAVPTNLNLHEYGISDPRLYLTLGSFALIALGVFALLRRNTDQVGEVLLALGLIGFMQLQKHAVRPIDWALMHVLFVGLAYLLIQFARRRGGGFASLLFGMIAGTIFSLYLSAGLVGHAAQRLAESPNRLVTALGLMGSETRRAEANADLFSDNRFAGYKEELDLVKDPRFLASPKPFIVLTDMPVLYILAQQKAPYQVNSFSTSPLVEQKKVATDLTDAKTPTLVIDRRNLSIDNVAHAVRLPLVYAAAVRNYTYVSSVGPFDILKWRGETQPMDVEYWNGLLGSIIELGYIPAYAAKPDAACDTDCAPYLQLVVPEQTAANQPLVITLAIDNRSYRLRLVTKAGKTEYWIRLDRLWAVALSAAPTIEVKEVSLPTIKVDIIRSGGRGALY